MTKSTQMALEWMRKRGGDAAVARSKKGGLFVLAQGEVGPFTSLTRLRLINMGMAEYTPGGGTMGVRFRLTPKGLSYGAKA